MKKLLISTLIIFSIGLSSSFATDNEDESYLTYEVDLTNYEDDLFHVTLYPGKLSKDNQYYNFVAFAPGVHQTLNYGRFVQSFQAYDMSGNTLLTEKISTNRWEISAPEKVHKIKYIIEDSFDSEIKEQRISPMSATGIEDNYIIMNTFGVIGYFDDLLSNPVKLKVDYNPDWDIGTALNKDEDGYYSADSYYHLADSPILMGDLSYQNTMVGDINVEVFVYSPNDTINADTILTLANDALNSAVEFASFAPVDRYTFLMYYSDRDAMKRNKFNGFGALEHSYSSTYAMPASPQVIPMMTDIIAHEFMHILTPLNLRSEIIAYFDYSKPSTEDMHVWLYEGVTDWVAYIMPLRSGMIDVETHLSAISKKINNSDEYDTSYSLVRISTDWPTEEGIIQYNNIYQLGAVTAELLDIKLLELSDGKKGLREVYLELISKYGKDKPFNNDTFFDVFVEMTYPEIREFINSYISGNQPLPYEEYYKKLGIKYSFSQVSEDTTPVLGLSLVPVEHKFLGIKGFSRNHKNFGLEKGDVIIKILGEDLTMENARELLEMKNVMKAGDEYEITVKREEEELTFTGVLFERMDYHVLTVDENSTEEQKRLRDIWSSNLPLSVNQ
jgi:predicted metalloprotease with PDZ domain